MTQIEKLNKQLVKMRKNITTQDKKDCMEFVGKHANTIQNYLSGNGKDADLCATMIGFYQNKIESRNKVLA